MRQEYARCAHNIFCICPTADFPSDPAGDGVYEAPPVDAPAIHKAVEHILLAGEQLAETAARIIGGVLHGEERGQDEQFQHLREGELAARILDRSDHFGLYGEAFHHCCYALYRPAGVIVFEKTLEFTDYLSIFVHGKRVLYVCSTTTELSNTFAFFIRVLFHLRNLSKEILNSF